MGLFNESLYLSEGGAGGLGGSIADTQVAFGDPASEITGSADLTWDGAILNVNGGNLTVDSQNNTFWGKNSGDAISTGTSNTGCGFNSLPAVSTGASNTALGANALAADSSGSGNVGIGSSAGVAISGGDFNMLIGNSAGRLITFGSENIAFGRLAGDVTTTGDNNTTIGIFTGPPGAGTSNHLNIRDLIFANTLSGFVRLGSSGVVAGPDKLEVVGDTCLNGGLKIKATQTAVSANFTSSNIIMAVTDTSAARTITIQTADIANTDKVFIVKDESGAAGTNNITIATQGAETIDGAATVTIAANFGVVKMYTDGSNLFTL